MEEMHSFKAKRISKENARLNYVMGEIFKVIEENAKLGMFSADITGAPIASLNDLEQSLCIRRLTALLYKVDKTANGILINWKD